LQTELKTRDADSGGELTIEGYFAVFNRQTELWPGAFEEILPGAFANSIKNNDIRALINHDSTLVLGRTKNSTLELREDSYGLWGRIRINPNDTDAVNLYERVRRGDADQCSFGFNIPPGGETTDYRDDGTVKWTVRETDTKEISVVTFPAYEDTGVQARKAEVAQHRERQLQQRKQNLKARLKS
jgi:HK97 family phage prohead protease